jgi:hypothetical protein
MDYRRQALPTHEYALASRCATESAQLAEALDVAAGKSLRTHGLQSHDHVLHEVTWPHACGNGGDEA